VSPTALTVFRWELRKLRFQKRTYLGLGAAVAVPIIFAVATSVQSGGPDDVPFGRYIQTSGLAIPLVLLLFGSIWLYPLITALVAGTFIAQPGRLEVRLRDRGLTSDAQSFEVNP